MTQSIICFPAVFAIKTRDVPPDAQLAKHIFSSSSRCILTSRSCYDAAFKWTWLPCKVILKTMDADERDICLYLKTFPGQFVSFKDISRRAGGKRRYHNEPEWATQVLSKLVEKGFIESDSTGHYRLKVRTEQEKAKSRWVSPQIRRILEKSGKEFDGVFEVDKDDDEELLS